MLLGLKGLAQVNTNCLSNLWAEALAGLKQFRLNLRLKSLANVNEPILKKKLLDLDLFCTDLFPPEAASVIQDAIAAPPSRMIKVASNKPNPSKPSNSNKGNKDKDNKDNKENKKYIKQM